MLPVGRSARDAADGESVGENGAVTVKGERNGSAAAEDKNGNI